MATTPKVQGLRADGVVRNEKKAITATTADDALARIVPEVRAAAHDQFLVPPDHRKAPPPVDVSRLNATERAKVHDGILGAVLPALGGQELPEQLAVALRGVDRIYPGERSGRSKNWNPRLDGPKASSAYVVNGRMLFITDPEKRTVVAIGQQQKVSQPRLNRRWSDAAALPGDQGGHLINAAQSGPSEKINIWPWRGPANSSEHRVNEIKWEVELQQRDRPATPDLSKHRVVVGIHQAFEGASTRPASIGIWDLTLGGSWIDRGRIAN